MREDEHIFMKSYSANVNLVSLKIHTLWHLLKICSCSEKIQCVQERGLTHTMTGPKSYSSELVQVGIKVSCKLVFLENNNYDVWKTTHF